MVTFSIFLDDQLEQMDLVPSQHKLTKNVGFSLTIKYNVKQKLMGKSRLCVVLNSAQGLNLNANEKLSFSGKLSHCLNGGM